MWLQNPVLTVHNVEGSHGGFVIQGKHENLVGVGQIFGRAGREDGDSKAAGYRLADGLQIVHAGYNVQGRSRDISFFQIAVNFLLVPEPVSRIIKGSLRKSEKSRVPESIFC